MKKFTDQELLKLLDGSESDHVEYKSSFKGDMRNKVRKTVCAFANDLPDNGPGVLFIGANDDGSPSNEPITDEVLRNLSDIASDGKIMPLPTLFIKKRKLKGADMAVVTVMPSDIPPVKYEGRIWIRTGPRLRIASEQEERVLNERRRHKDIPFDMQPIPTARLSDLDRSIFENQYLPQAFAEEVLEQNDRSYEQRLASCRMVASPDDAIPTVTGLLAIGKSPQDFLRGAYIQFLRISGTELADPVVDAEEITGNIVNVLRRTEEKLKAHNRTAVNISAAPTHQISSSYPHVALQQILYNAVLHRTYEKTNAPVRIYWFNDRIEMISPGGPYGRVTTDNFGQPGITDYRNPGIADVLKTFGFVQRFGRGINTANKEMEKNGNPPLEFEPSQSIVVCAFRSKI